MSSRQRADDNREPREGFEMKETQLSGPCLTPKDKQRPAVVTKIEVSRTTQAVAGMDFQCDRGELPTECVV